MPFDINVQTTLSQGVQSIAALTGQAIPPDPAGSTDPSVRQMVTAMNQAASELYAIRDWQELRQQMTIQVIADSAGQLEKGFPLPDDYGRFVDGTQWAQNQRWPAVGPIQPQGWMTYLVNNLSPTTSIFWQIRNDKLFVLRPPFPVASPFTAFYISRGYIIDQDDPTLFKNQATKNGDTFLLDGQLVTLFGRVKWLEYKGFDTSAAMRDYQTQFDSRAGSDEGAAYYNLSGRGGVPLLNVSNLPDTGFGS